MTLKLSLNWLLALVPVAVGLELAHAPAPYIFFAAALGIVPIAALVAFHRRSRIQVRLPGAVALHIGDAAALAAWEALPDHSRALYAGDLSGSPQICTSTASCCGSSRAMAANRM